MMTGDDNTVCCLYDVLNPVYKKLTEGEEEINMLEAIKRFKTNIFISK